MRAKLLPLACVALLACGACSADPTEPKQSSASPAAGHATTSTQASPSTLPIGAEPVSDIYPTAERKYKLEKKVTELQNECLKQSGGSPQQPVSEQTFVSQVLKANSVVYGITDKQMAAKYGFSVPTQGENTSNPVNPLPNHTTQEPKPFAEGDAGNANPAPSQGTGDRNFELCIQNVNKRVFGDTGGAHSLYSLGSQLFMQAWKSSLDSPEVKALWSEWKTCMKSKGHSNVPGDPVDPKMFPARTDSSKASAAEIKAALDDIECKGSVGLVEKWAPVVRKQLTDLRSKNASDVSKAVSAVNSL